MPELPEVEVTRLGLEPYITEQAIKKMVIREPRLRWPIPSDLNLLVRDKTIVSVVRRGKYLLLGMQGGTLLMHLGMSGSLRLLREAVAPKKHDHFDILFKNGMCLRYTDPRRFGAALWTGLDPYQHPLLQSLGVEPLEPGFDGKFLQAKLATRKTAIKTNLMDANIVVGVGNIYANEALFAAGILPTRPANSLSLAEYNKLAKKIKQVLAAAIKQGGTTLRDFQQSDGKLGYFKHSLQVYGKRKARCLNCKGAITEVRINNRATYFCESCQK